jgi:uncharacterized protein YchJ
MQPRECNLQAHLRGYIIMVHGKLSFEAIRQKEQYVDNPDKTDGNVPEVEERQSERAQAEIQVNAFANTTLAMGQLDPDKARETLREQERIRLREGTRSLDAILRQASQAASSRPGRNDPCPCGSGKKFKACCMRKMPG